MNGLRYEFPDLVPAFDQRECPVRQKPITSFSSSSFSCSLQGVTGIQFTDPLGFTRVAEETSLIREKRGIRGSLHSLIQVPELFCAVRIDGVEGPRFDETFEYPARNPRAVPLLHPGTEIKGYLKGAVFLPLPS